MTTDPLKLFSDWRGHEGASDEDIHQVEMKRGAQLPEEYKELMRRTNGGQGRIADRVLRFWSVRELSDHTLSRRIRVEIPQLIPFADDGPDFYAFDIDRHNLIVRVPFGDTATRMWETVASTISGMLQRIREGE